MQTISIRGARFEGLTKLIGIAIFGALAISAQVYAQHIVKYDAPWAGTTEAWQGTIGVGIAQDGTAMGFYHDARFAAHGFVRTPDGMFTKIDAPGAGQGVGPCPKYDDWCNFQGTYPFGMNRKGAIAGYMLDAKNVYHGFVRNPDGQIKTYKVPGAGWSAGQGTIFGDITDDGAVAGYYTDAKNVTHGFLLMPDGKLTRFNVPEAGKGAGQGTFPQFFSCLNHDGTVTGFYVDAQNAYHGFVRGGDGTIELFDAPNAGTEAGQGTIAYSINEAREITGPYYDASGMGHGFVLNRHGGFERIDIAGAGTAAGQGTFPETNNNAGEIAGQWVDGNNANHGWARMPDGRIIKFDVWGAGTGAGQGTIPMTDNVEGVVNGVYLDAKGVEHGFLWFPR